MLGDFKKNDVKVVEKRFADFLVKSVAFFGMKVCGIQIEEFYERERRGELDLGGSRNKTFNVVST